MTNEEKSICNHCGIYGTFGNFDKYTMVHLFWPQDHKAVFDLSKKLYAEYKFYHNIQIKLEIYFRIVSLSCCYGHSSNKNLRLISIWWVIVF